MSREQVQERLDLLQSLASMSKVYPHWAGLYGKCIDVIERQQTALADAQREIERLKGELAEAAALTTDYGNQQDELSTALDALAAERQKVAALGNALNVAHIALCQAQGFFVDARPEAASTRIREALASDVICDALKTAGKAQD